MKVLGIIAEYNPFHNGHQYQITTMKSQLQADYCIVAMSGDFVQRGAPAIVDKYLRAKMALLSGADLVIQLPVSCSTASAEGFAFGGISLLNQLQILDVLTYGCEFPDLSMLQMIAQLLAEEPASYQALLKHALSQGSTYPAAQSHALVQYLISSKLLESSQQQQIRELLQSPNSILALEYEKAKLQTGSKFQSVPLLRSSSSYHSLDVCDSICSASALRELIRSAQDTSAHVPASANQFLQQYLETQPALFENSFSSFLRYKLLSEQSGFESYLDCSNEISSRIQNQLDNYQDFTSFCHLLHTKEITYGRISRVLTHILLNITSLSEISYAKVLGFRRDSADLLSAVVKKSRIPIVTSVSDGYKNLPQTSRPSLDQDLFARDLYRHALIEADGCLLPNEYKQPLIIL